MLQREPCLLILFSVIKISFLIDGGESSLITIVYNFIVKKGLLPVTVNKIRWHKGGDSGEVDDVIADHKVGVFL